MVNNTEREIGSWNKFKDAVITCAIFDFTEEQLFDYIRLTYNGIEEGKKLKKENRISTEMELVEVLKRLDRCENHAQICYVFDHIPEKIKMLLREE